MPIKSDTSSLYVGRFAPSPSGQLHFGSLVTAVASFLDARYHKGKWLVRMEDIDTPRCIKGVDSDILRTLECHGLNWDGDVLYQHQQHSRYHTKLAALIDSDKAYRCTCTRKQIKAMGGHSRGKCGSNSLGTNASAALSNAAIRLKLGMPIEKFYDGIMGEISLPTTLAEDVVLKRSDGLFSYQFVVALDDEYQGITHIIRGSDLLQVTPLQRCVYNALQCPIPEYAHIPVASVAPGRKLSKQNHAAPIDNNKAFTNLLKAMSFLGLSTHGSRDVSSPEALLQVAISRWDRKFVPKTAEIIVDKHESTYYNEPL